MSLINAFENIVLDAMLGAGATLLGATLDLALSTTTPADDGTNITEPAGLGYARVTINNDGSQWAAAASGSKATNADISFAAATGSWGTITHWVLYDSGVPKIWGTLDDGAGTPTPVAVADTDVVRFLSGNLRVDLD